MNGAQPMTTLGAITVGGKGGSPRRPWMQRGREALETKEMKGESE